MLRITRRSVLRRSAAFGLMLAAPALWTSHAAANTHGQAKNRLRIPSLLTARPRAGTDTFDLKLIHGETEFFKGVRTRTIGINQPYLGPTIRLTAQRKSKIEPNRALDNL